MEIPVSDAKSRLTDLVRRAEAGEVVTLTRHGTPVVRLTPVRDRPPAAVIVELIANVQAEAARTARPAPVDLFDESGLPC
jgi:prevent-host-death family protein